MVDHGTITTDTVVEIVEKFKAGKITVPTDNLMDLVKEIYKLYPKLTDAEEQQVVEQIHSWLREQPGFFELEDGTSYEDILKHIGGVHRMTPGSPEEMIVSKIVHGHIKLHARNDKEFLRNLTERFPTLTRESAWTVLYEVKRYYRLNPFKYALDLPDMSHEQIRDELSKHQDQLIVQPTQPTLSWTAEQFDALPVREKAAAFEAAGIPSEWYRLHISMGPLPKVETSYYKHNPERGVDEYTEKTWDASHTMVHLQEAESLRRQLIEQTDIIDRKVEAFRVRLAPLLTERARTTRRLLDHLEQNPYTAPFQVTRGLKNSVSVEVKGEPVAGIYHSTPHNPSAPPLTTKIDTVNMMAAELQDKVNERARRRQYTKPDKMS